MLALARSVSVSGSVGASLSVKMSVSVKVSVRNASWRRLGGVCGRLKTV